MTGETVPSEAANNHAKWLARVGDLGETALQWVVGGSSRFAAEQVIDIQRTDAELAAATAQAHQNAQ